MPAPAHDRVTWKGVFGGVNAPIEEWNFSLAFTPANYATETARSDAANTGAAAYASRIAPIMPPDIILTAVRVDEVGADGHLKRTPEGAYKRYELILADPIEGTEVFPVEPLPLQMACCVSLVTARAGASGKGRFFLPPPARQLTGDRVWAQESVEFFATSAAGFINDLNVNSNFPGSAVVASGGGLTGGPALYPITAVRVGRVPDTMRSRRSRVPESYTTEPV